jgi:hypothetical protein
VKSKSKSKSKLFGRVGKTGKTSKTKAVAEKIAADSAAATLSQEEIYSAISKKIGDN